MAEYRNVLEELFILVRIMIISAETRMGLKGCKQVTAEERAGSLHSTARHARRARRARA